MKNLWQVTDKKGNAIHIDNHPLLFKSLNEARKAASKKNTGVRMREYFKISEFNSLIPDKKLNNLIFKALVQAHELLVSSNVKVPSRKLKLIQKGLIYSAGIEYKKLNQKSKEKLLKKGGVL